MTANDVVPDVGKGSEHATNVAEGRQLPSPLTGPSLGLPLEIDEQKEAVGPSSQDLRQMHVRVGELRRYREHEAARPTPESDVAEQTGHMRELAAVESS